MFIADLYNEEKGTVTSRRNKTLSIEKTTVSLYIRNSFYNENSTVTPVIYIFVTW